MCKNQIHTFAFMKLPKNLNQKLEDQKQDSSVQKLRVINNLVDFSSDDYLGFSKSEMPFKLSHKYLLENEILKNQPTESLLISENHSLYQITTSFIREFHEVESALIFSSAYDANLCFFSVIPHQNDVVLYDELSHAFIRDGIAMSKAASYTFSHNDFEDLENLILKFPETTIYIVTESVFSMDGDSPNLEELVALSEKYNCRLIVDESHALGVFGEKGEGLLQFLTLHKRIFARIVTFGDAFGCQGTVFLGSSDLKKCIVNFSIGLSRHDVAAILYAYERLEIEKESIEKLRQNIIFFNQQKNLLGLKPMFVRSKSAIQSAIIPGIENAKRIVQQFQDKGFDVKAIFSPIVPEGQERLRFCIHSYNTEKEINQLLKLLADFIF